MIDNITPEVFGRLLGAAKVGVEIMQAMINNGTFPGDWSRDDVIGHMELSKQAIYEAEYPTAAEKVDAHIRALAEERGNDDPLVKAVCDILNRAIRFEEIRDAKQEAA
jgi:hypothetical protein